MSKNKNKILILLFIISLMGLQYFFGPKRVEYKEKIKLVEVVKTEVRTITKTEKRPDGTSITTITSEQIKENTKSKDTEVNKKVTPVKKDWFVTGTYGIKGDYSLSIQRRVIFDLYAGVYARSDKEIGLSVSFNF